MRLKLRSVGNPDRQQFAPVSNPQTVEVATLAEARRACINYIEEWNLGGGNWPKTYVYDGYKNSKARMKKIAHISYNGRVWDLNDNEIKI